MAIRQQCSNLTGLRQISPSMSDNRISTICLVNQQELRSLCGDSNRPMIYCQFVQCPDDHLTRCGKLAIGSSGPNNEPPGRPWNAQVIGCALYR